MKMSATFEQWAQTAFDHPFAEPEWYWDQGFESLWEALGLTDALTVRYLTRVFLEPELLKRYSLEQVAQGIWFLIGEAQARLRPHQPRSSLGKALGVH
jgi:hypothetical protein